MLDSNESVGFLNPDTYLNHLSPAQGSALRIENDILIIILGVRNRVFLDWTPIEVEKAALWDILAYLAIDAKIVRGSRFNINIFCFIFTRLTALGFICLSISRRMPPVVFDPKLLPVFAGCLCMLSFMMSSLLFLHRVLAVYNGNPRVRRSFILFWIVVALSRISDIVIPFARSPEENRGIIRKDSGINVWATTCVWLTFLFDTAVTLAISYKFWTSFRTPYENVPWYQSLSGGTLPRLPRMIFRSGLQYYLILVVVMFMTGIVLCLPSAPKSYNAMFQSILVFLMASMTSRVFRNVRLFDSDDVLTEPKSLSIV